MRNYQRIITGFLSKYNLRILVFSCILFIITILLEFQLQKRNVSQKISSFRTTLEKTASELRNNVDLHVPDSVHSITNLSIKLASEKTQNPNFIIQLFDADSLIFWTGNRIGSKNIFPKSDSSEGKLIFISNGWYWTTHITRGKYTVWGFALIKNQYAIQNDYLQTDFTADFSLSSKVQISDSKKTNFRMVSDLKGNAICYLDFSQDHTHTGCMYAINFIIFLISLICLIIGINGWIKSLNNNYARILALCLSSTVLVATKIGMSVFVIPGFLYNYQLFSPSLFASSSFMNSLGDVFVWGLILFYFSYRLVNEINVFKWVNEQKNQIAYLFISCNLLGIAILFFYIVYLIKSLVLNSNLSFEFYHIANISLLSFVALFTIALFLISFMILLRSIIKAASHLISFSKFVVFCLIAVLFLLLTCFLLDIGIGVYASIFFMCIVVIASVMHYYLKSFKPITQLFVSVFILSILCSILLLHNISQRQLSEKKLLATTLYTEHDPVAEDHLFEIDRQLRSDTALKSILINDKFSFNQLLDYLHSQYFNGYWNNYDLQVTLCDQDDSLVVKSDWQRQLCNLFFEELINLKGNRIDTLMFYNLEDHNGIISYLGRFHVLDSIHDVSVFIELDAKNNIASIGYPLLLVNKNRQQVVHQNYSIAKYNNGELVSQSGPFNYLYNIQSYPSITQEYELHSINGYEQLFYKPEKEFMVVIGSAELRFIDKIIMFSYILVFFILLGVSFLFVKSILLHKKIVITTFRNKILSAIIGVSMVALLTLGIALIYLLMHQYNDRYNNVLREKLNSIYYYLTENAEVNAWLNDNANFSTPEFNTILQQASEFYSTDINVYSLDGRLIATSRPEFFQKKLMGELIQPDAFYKLYNVKSSEFILKEQIGKLEYLSAYTPIQNNMNQTVAYLNVPYFSRQDELQDEISKLSITIINISVLLVLLSVLIAFILSNALTYPLRLIQSRFSQIRLGELNNKIEYNGHDEVGDLVEAYNGMVDELDKNIKLLAKSERESAWREMAKQVAHEIKNPLTPMKLSIQQLQRMLNDKGENREAYIQKTSQTLLQQIDNLSRIATEFSNLAKMPGALNERFEITAAVEYVMNLYSDKNIVFEHPSDTYFIYADKEQIQRVFINLITNALQAIPADRKEEIAILMYPKNQNIYIEIKDNGMGIDTEVENNLFQPNFTTKTSGSGLGLTIVKNILESSGGFIQYKANPIGGAIFIICIPYK